MTRSALLAVVAAVLMAGIAPQQRAWCQEDSDDHQRSMGNLRPDSSTGGRAVQGSNRYRARRSPRVVIPAPTYYAYPRYYPGYRLYYAPGSYGYYPYYGAAYPYYYRTYRYVPPVFVPGDQLYGPGAVRRFLGYR